jgi:hypothetical protein
MTKYLANNLWNPSIEQVEIERETDKSVFLGGGARRDKETADSIYTDTWAQSHSYLMTKAQIRVEQARRALETANSKLGNVEELKPFGRRPE